MTEMKIPELWEWAEYYCPWCYVAAVRLQKIAPEYQGRVRLRERAFPLEIFGGGPPDRKELELEIWLAALQEPDAVFKPFKDDWPTTTLSAFEGAWCAFQQGELIGHDFDLRTRRAFFYEGRNIGQPQVVWEIAREAGLDMDHFSRVVDSGVARAAVLEEGRLGKEVFKVRGTPTGMLPDGKKLRHPIAYPSIENGRIRSVGKLPCCGEGCYEITRAMFDQALKHEQEPSIQAAG
jgi:predicted DsbA family dithiol-disulfide isomerase